MTINITFHKKYRCRFAACTLLFICSIVPSLIYPTYLHHTTNPHAFICLSGNINNAQLISRMNTYPLEYSYANIPPEHTVVTASSSSALVQGTDELKHFLTYADKGIPAFLRIVHTVDLPNEHVAATKMNGAEITELFYDGKRFFGITDVSRLYDEPAYMRFFNHPYISLIEISDKNYRHNRNLVVSTQENLTHEEYLKIMYSSDLNTALSARLLLAFSE